VHWTYDTYALGYGLGQAITKEGGKTWFIVTADYTFGKDLEQNCSDAVTANGGKVLGVVRHPINTADFSSFLLQAQSSGADVVGFANAGGDTSQSLKQAAEFGLGQQQRLAALVFDLQHVPPLGLEAAQGVKTIQAFYWDANDATRDFAKRFSAAHPKGEYPNHMHAGMYSATAHLIKAVAQTKSADDGAKVVETMKAMPTDDPLFGKGQIRVDGRHIHPMYLYETKGQMGRVQARLDARAKRRLAAAEQGRVSACQILTSTPRRFGRLMQVRNPVHLCTCRED
jgi:branched-chain amino acid transport system substrate-binding protein